MRDIYPNLLPSDDFRSWSWSPSDAIIASPIYWNWSPFFISQHRVTRWQISESEDHIECFWWFLEAESVSQRSWQRRRGEPDYLVLIVLCASVRPVNFLHLRVGGSRGLCRGTEGIVGAISPFSFVHALFWWQASYVLPWFLPQLVWMTTETQLFAISHSQWLVALRPLAL